MAETLTYAGKVAWSSDTVIRIEGTDAWLSKSTTGKAAKLEMPKVGQDVTITTRPWNNRLYIQAISYNTPVALQEPQDAEQGHTMGVVYPDKDRRISRLAVLNTAVALLSHNVPAGVCVKAGDVLALAEQLEAWVYRKEG